MVDEGYLDQQLRVANRVPVGLVATDEANV